MSILARSKPYTTTPTGTYVCHRCGITKNKHSGNSGYCNDCKRFVPKEHE